MGMKFIRGLIYPEANFGNGRGTPYRMKWFYEFWGFCVNGTASTTVPGGFAANNGVVMPTNFTGGTSLMASGTDGSHPAISGELFSGDCIFTANASSPFTIDMVGKALVMWKPNSDSSEDSIYLITRVLSPTQIQININTGGIPNATTKHPSMTARTNVNYRVVDMYTGFLALYSQSVQGGKYMVIDTDASSINPGQANSKIQLCMRPAWSATYPGDAQVYITLAGTGLWDGTPTAVSSVTNTTPISVTTAAPHGYETGQTVSITDVGGAVFANGSFVISVTGANTFTLDGTAGAGGTYTSGGTIYNGFPNDGYAGIYVANPESGAAYTGGLPSITMIADKTFAICHIREQDVFQNGNHFGFHFEIPTRLYPQGQDLHPVAFMHEAQNQGWLYTTGSTTSYGGGFRMRTHSADTSTIRTYRTLVKSLFGDGTLAFPTYSDSGGQGTFGQRLIDYRIGYNTIAGTIPMSDAILAQTGTANQFSLARVRLRTVKFTGVHVPKHHIIGLNGEFIQMTNGICWPWDNTIIPHQLLLFG